MEKVELKEIIKLYPVAEKDSGLLKALLADFNPQNKLENNLIWLAHTVGVNDDLKKKHYVNEQDMFNLTRMLEKTYGMGYTHAYYAVKTWADLYGIKCSPMAVISGENDNMNASQYDDRHNPGTNEIVWENEDVQVTYKNIEGLDMTKVYSIFSLFYVNYIFKNKTDRDINICLFDVSMNGIVFEEWSTRDTIGPGEVKSVQSTFFLHSVQNIGFFKNEELDELSFELAYAFGKPCFRYNEKVDSKVMAIKIK